MDEHRKMRGFEAKVAAGVAAFAVLIVALYFITFRGLPIGGPADWAGFGDYVGGLLNPAVGIATVLLVLSTLWTTRKIAEGQDILLRQQLDVAKLESALKSLEVRMDGVLAEWKRITTNRVWTHGDYFTMHGHNPTYPGKGVTLEDLFLSSEWQDAARERNQDDEVEDQYVKQSREKYFSDLTPLVGEMAVYVGQYRRLAPEGVEADWVTDYYCRRMESGIRMLESLGLLHSETKEYLAPKIDLHF